ncbi:MAG: transcriptional regulator [Candidatus Thermoplasmatota archaeon]|nr:transcriptional regulator [Candidatus Thermoplasmatota archaeon]MDI6855644.1 transcriptional regulator [Candidatus Thermoplasmatota archaeon]
MVKLKAGTLEERILKVLLSKYPITAEELQAQLAVREDTLERALSALQIKGIILLEPLQDKTFIRVTQTGIEFIGKSPSQRKALKRKKGKKKAVEKVKESDVMYA